MKPALDLKRLHQASVETAPQYEGFEDYWRSRPEQKPGMFRTWGQALKVLGLLAVFWAVVLFFGWLGFRHFN